MNEFNLDSPLIYILGQIGVAVFAISGAIAAGRKGLDWVGVLTLATATSLGGGTIRDLLLNRESVFWIADTTYLWVNIAAASFTIAYTKFLPPPAHSLRIADALGLALFTIVGAQIAEAEGAAPLVVVVMAVLTGVAGGVIRDVLTREIPLIFRSSETVYSVTSLGGVLAYLGLQQLGLEKQYASLIGIILVATFRFLAIAFKVKLPAFHITQR